MTIPIHWRKAVLFLAISSVALIALNLLYYFYIIKPINESWQNEFESFAKTLGNRTLTIGFFGSSHSAFAANPKYFPRAYNFAKRGVNYKAVSGMYETVTDNYAIEVAIFELDLPIFSRGMRDSSAEVEDLILAANRPVTTMEWFLYYRKRCLAFSNLSFFDTRNIRRCLPATGNGINVFLFDRNELRSNTGNLGWIRGEKNFSDLLPEQRFKSVQSKQADHFTDGDISLNNSLPQLFQTLDLARNRSIIVLIIYPTSYEYHLALLSRNISPERKYSEIFQKVNDTGLQYYLLNYYTLFFEHPEYFQDPDHLNYMGAEVLSKKIYQDLKNAGISQY